MRLTRIAAVVFISFLLLPSAIFPAGTARADESEYYSVTINSNIPSVDITIDGVPYSSTNSTFMLTNTAHQITVPNDVTIEYNKRYVFMSWGDGNAALPRTIYQGGEFTAHYSIQCYFNVSAEQGEVEGSGWYSPYITATTTFARETIINGNTRYLFKHWDVDSSPETGNPITVSMNTPHTANADYQTQHYLSVSSEHGTVNGSGWYDAYVSAETGEALDITEGNTRYAFQYWDVDGSERIGNPIQVIMNAPHTATADYNTQYYLDVQSEYGSVDGAGWHDTNSSAQVSVKPIVGTLIRHKFNGWSGDIGSNESTVSIYIDQPKTIVATWKTDFLFLHVLIGGLIAVIVAAAVAVPTAVHIRKKHG